MSPFWHLFLISIATFCIIFVGVYNYMKAPDRLYRCPECGYVTVRRWVLARHLYNVHNYYGKDAAETAIRSEYRLNPYSFRPQDLRRRYENEE